MRNIAAYVFLALLAVQYADAAEGTTDRCRSAHQSARSSCVSSHMQSSGKPKGVGSAFKKAPESQRAALLQQHTRGSDIAADAVVETHTKLGKASKSTKRVAYHRRVHAKDKDKSEGVGITGHANDAGDQTEANSGALAFFQTGSDENDSVSDDAQEEQDDEVGSQMPQTEATMRAAAMVMFGALAVLVIAATACGVVATGAFAVKKNFRARTSSVRQRAQQLRVTSGADIHNMFASEGNCSHKHQPSSSGNTVRRSSPMRLQGKIKSEPEATQLQAPFSGRPCVIYSASTSQNRSDGVHQPPVAFHSAGIDFTIELLESPLVTVAVHSQDISLFDMAAGRVASEQAFNEAPDAWRSFTLAHLMPRQDAANFGMTHVDVGIAGQGPLEFNECSLAIGSTVTCIGEIARDRTGGLHLYPWRPPSVRPEPTQSLSWYGRFFPWLTTSWTTKTIAREAALATEIKTQLPEVQPRDSLANHVLISDDPTLLM